KPYAVKRHDREDIYIRVGSISRLANREQIIRLAQESGFHSEVLPVSGSTVTDLDLSLISFYLKQAYNEDFKSELTNVILNRLEQLDLVVKQERLGWVCSLAGIILFGKNPKRFLNQSGFRVIGYKGEQADYDTFIDEELNLPIAELRDKNGKVTQFGLISLLIEKLKPFLVSEKVDASGIRHEVWLYPFEVLRELIVNSLTHRDWTKANTNKIELFSDRFEITSFGSLPNTLTWEKIVAGQQYPRNPLLIRIIKDYGYMDDRGLGIRRKVIPILKEEGYPQLFSEPTEDYLKLIVHKRAE
ncbi:MAG: ATP-binding protein, partial [Ignavibacteria bacterium]|nr:ATP-binding protein [Ignavibacteria bacterium]